MRMQPMLKWYLILLNAIVITGALRVSDAQELRNPSYDTDRIPPSVFKARRDSVMAHADPNSILLFITAPEHARNADVDYRYRQDDNFHYLTGFDEPNAVLILIPGGWTTVDPEDNTRYISLREILFVQPRNKMMESWTGRRYGPAGAVKFLGLQHALPIDQLKSMLPAVLGAVSPGVLYAPTVPTEVSRQFAGALAAVQAAVDSQKAAQRTMRDPNGLVRAMRIVKSPEEIALITKATTISALAHRQAMMSCEPGMFEFELQAVYEYVYTKLGAEYPAYPCIVGSGENSVILHYESNRRQMKAGDLVVADCAAEYHNYASDITRTYPVNGKFTDIQKKVYQVVLTAQKAAVEMMQPGVTMKEVSDRVDELLEAGLVKLGLIKEPGERQLRKFYTHGLGHAVGLDVHDVQNSKPLEPGMVFTIEPGVYIPEGMEGVDPSFYNIGVRIEDIILITPTGSVNLSAAVPKEISEIEALMVKKGIGNQPVK